MNEVGVQTQRLGLDRMLFPCSCQTPMDCVYEGSGGILAYGVECKRRMQMSEPKADDSHWSSGPDEVKGARYDRDAPGMVSLDAQVMLDEPERLMYELEKIAEDLSRRNPRSNGWRFIAKWVKEGNEEFAKMQEPPPR